MFFQKKKPKIDPKIRFQNRQFNQKLHAARTFKRTAKPIPDGSFDRFLRNIGLGSRWMQIFVALIVLGVVYVIYAPNFLSVQAIRIEGLSDEEAARVQSAVEDKLNNTPFYNPQRNLLFLSKDRVAEAALSVAGIDTVEKITKNFGQKTLYVTLRPKHERFLVRTRELVFDVYNDGTLKGQAGLDIAQWSSIVNPGMAKVEVAANVPAQDSRQFFSPDTVKYMIQLQEALKGIVGSPLVYFSMRIPELKEQQDMLEATRKLEEEKLQAEESEEEIDAESGEEPSAEGEAESQPVEEVTAEPQPVALPSIDITLPVNADELDVVLQKGTNAKRTFRVIVDTKENPEQLVQRLNLLLSQTAPDRYDQLSYIDLRIQPRAYVCLLNTVCNR